MAIDFSLLSSSYMVYIVAGALGGLIIYLILQIMKVRTILTVIRKHSRMVRIITDDGREFIEPENCDATDHHFSKIFPDRVFGPLKKDNDTKFMGFIPTYTFSINNSAVLEPYTIVGMSRLMEITGTMTPKQALDAVGANNRANHAITEVINIGERIGLDNLVDLEQQFNREARQIEEPHRSQLENYLRVCKEVAKTYNVNSKLSFEELRNIRDTFLKLPTVKVKVLQQVNGEIHEVEEEHPLEYRSRDGMPIDLKVVARSFEGQWHPRDKFSFYNAAVEEGAKTASVDYDVRKIIEHRKAFMWFIIGGIGVLAILALAVLFGPQAIEKASTVIAERASGGGGSIISSLTGGN